MLLVETFIFNLLLKTNRFYLLSCFRDSGSRKPLFLTKTGKHVVTLTPFMADISILASFPFVKMCKIDGLEGTQNLVTIRTIFGKYLSKTREGK